MLDRLMKIAERIEEKYLTDESFNHYEFIEDFAAEITATDGFRGMDGYTLARLAWKELKHRNPSDRPYYYKGVPMLG